MYKNIKEITHVEVGEEDIHHHHIYIYIYIKDKHNICKNSHKTSVQDAKRISYSNKEVSTPPNKMKHISPLQKNVFLPLTCRILTRNHIFSSFLSWLTKGIKSYKTSLEKHKDDQGGIRSLYKCMNVMNKDAMDDKIIERCKTCEKQCMQEGLNRSRSCQGCVSQT